MKKFAVSMIAVAALALGVSGASALELKAVNDASGIVVSLGEANNALIKGGSLNSISASTAVGASNSLSGNYTGPAAPLALLGGIDIDLSDVSLSSVNRGIVGSAASLKAPKISGGNQGSISGSTAAGATNSVNLNIAVD